MRYSSTFKGFGTVLSMYSADRVWPRGDDSAREWEHSCSEWKRGCRRTYQRNATEYITPAKHLEIVTHDEMRHRSVLLTDSYDNRAAAWTAARGTDFAPAKDWSLEPAFSPGVMLVLVPIPENSYDFNAIAVELHGQKLGNMSAAYSRQAQLYIRQLNYLGYRVFTPGFVRAFYREEIQDSTPEAFIAMPTFRSVKDALPPMDGYVAGFEALWNRLEPTPPERKWRRMVFG